jgi:hypothetical protein
MDCVRLLSRCSVLGMLSISHDGMHIKLSVIQVSLSIRIVPIEKDEPYPVTDARCSQGPMHSPSLFTGCFEKSAP